MPKPFVFALVLLGVSTSLIAGAAGAHADSTTAREDAACARARAAGHMCEISIDGDTIDADRPSGTGTQVFVANWGKHDSLIRLRLDFIAEILKSASDLE